MPGCVSQLKNPKTHPTMGDLIFFHPNLTIKFFDDQTKSDKKPNSRCRGSLYDYSWFQIKTLRLYDSLEKNNQKNGQFN